MKARLVICVRFAGQTLKLAWFNEDRQGVYFGYFGRDKGHHFSYHADGKNHEKRLGKLIFEPLQSTAIEKVAGLEQIGGATSIPLGSMHRITDLVTKDSAAFRVFLPDPKDSVSYSHLGVTQFFLNTSAEDIGVEQLIGMHSGLPKTTVVGFVVSPLRYFPNHKLAIVITAKVA